VRDGRARFGFHVFNTVADADTAVRALARVN
jgi:selenocysteine lyase/cysteine desulfurase